MARQTWLARKVELIAELSTFWILMCWLESNCFAIANLTSDLEDSDLRSCATKLLLLSITCLHLRLLQQVPYHLNHPLWLMVNSWSMRLNQLVMTLVLSKLGQQSQASKAAMILTIWDSRWLSSVDGVRTIMISLASKWRTTQVNHQIWWVQRGTNLNKST